MKKETKKKERVKKFTPDELDKEVKRNIKKIFIAFVLIFVGFIVISVILYFSLKPIVLQNSDMDKKVLTEVFTECFFDYLIIFLLPAVLLGMAIYGVKCLDIKRVWLFVALLGLVVSWGYVSWECGEVYIDVTNEDCITYVGEYKYFARSFDPYKRNNRITDDAVRLIDDGNRSLSVVNDFCDTGRYEGKIVYLKRSGYIIDAEVYKELD